MEDTQIIELYFKRDEAALQETNAKYGAYCFRIAKNILESREDGSCRISSQDVLLIMVLEEFCSLGRSQDS